MTDEITTIDVGGDTTPVASDNTQYMTDPFEGNDLVLEAITQQIGEEEKTIDEPEDANTETEAEETGQEPDSTEDTEETTEEEVAEPEEEAPVEAKTTYKVKIDGKEMDVPDNAIFKLKVDGKTVQVSLADLATDYNGRTVWASKFSELGRERVNLQREKADILKRTEFATNALKAAGEALEAKNPLKAIIQLAKAQGLSAKEQVANFLIQADKSLADWSQMQPANRQLLLDQIELEQHRDRTAQQTKEVEETTRRQSILDQTEAMILAEGFTIQDYLDTSKWLVENSPESFTDDDVANRNIVLDTLRNTTQYLEIEDAALAVNSAKYKSLAPELKRELTSKLMKLKSIGEWNSKAELQEILVELLGKPKTQPKTSLASPKAAITTAKPNAPKGSLNKNPTPASQVDLEAIFRNVMESDI